MFYNKRKTRGQVLESDASRPKLKIQRYVLRFDVILLIFHEIVKTKGPGTVVKKKQPVNFLPVKNQYF